MAAFLNYRETGTQNRRRVELSRETLEVTRRGSLGSCEVLVALAAYARLPDLPTAPHQARRLRSPRSSALHLSPCRRDFTQLSGSAFSGYRWPAEVILAGMRWYLSYPLSARQVAELLAERGIDVSARTVLTWVQTFGPLLAKSHTAIGGG